MRVCLITAVWGYLQTNRKLIMEISTTLLYKKIFIKVGVLYFQQNYPFVCPKQCLLFNSNYLLFLILCIYFNILYLNVPSPIRMYTTHIVWVLALVLEIFLILFLDYSFYCLFEWLNEFEIRNIRIKREQK